MSFVKDVDDDFGFLFRSHYLFFYLKNNQNERSNVPILYTSGNHESSTSPNLAEAAFPGVDDGGECGQAYTRQLLMPTPSGEQFFWYSTVKGSVRRRFRCCCCLGGVRGRGGGGSCEEERGKEEEEEEESRSKKKKKNGEGAFLLALLNSPKQPRSEKWRWGIEAFFFGAFLARCCPLFLLLVFCVAVEVEVEKKKTSFPFSLSLLSLLPLLPLLSHHHHHHHYLHHHHRLHQNNEKKNAQTQPINSQAFFIQLNSDQSVLPGSTQRAWLLSTLAAVDRSKTPWLIVALHRPLYSDFAYQQEVERSWNLTMALEPIFFENR